MEVKKIPAKVARLAETAANRAMAPYPRVILYKDLGYTSRTLIQSVFPHKRPKPGINEFVRRSGNLTVSIHAPADPGLPFGIYPRLIKLWIDTEIYRTKNRILNPGKSFSEFLQKVGVNKNSSTARKLIIEQMERMMGTTIVVRYVTEDASGSVGERMGVATRWHLLWHKKNNDQQSLFDNFIEVSEEYFREVMKIHIPIDLEIVRAISRSPLALDIYCWLTARYYRLKHKQLIPWDAFQGQFGTTYGESKAFRRAVRNEMACIHEVYRDARFELGKEGILLLPSPTSVLPPARQQKK